MIIESTTATILFLFLTAAVLPTHSADYNKGYAHGVSDAKQAPNIKAPLLPDDIDCMDFPDHKLGAMVPEFCSGYQHGFADTINNATTTTNK